MRKLRRWLITPFWLLKAWLMGVLGYDKLQTQIDSINARMDHLQELCNVVNDQWMQKLGTRIQPWTMTNDKQEIMVGTGEPPNPTASTIELWVLPSSGDQQIWIEHRYPGDEERRRQVYAVKGCTCREVTRVGGHAYYGGIDDCPVHGFGKEEDDGQTDMQA